MSATPATTTGECRICEEESAQLILLPCGHQAQCAHCINQNFTGLNEANPRPACVICSAVIPLASIQHVLPSQVYARLEQEFATWHIPAPDRRYCHYAPCSNFLGSSQIGRHLHCSSCNNTTCSECKMAAHTGSCTPNTEFVETLNSVDANFSRCPHCGHLLERTQGCPHLTCVCSHQFCMHCRSDWDACQGNCEAARIDIHQLHGDPAPAEELQQQAERERAWREWVDRITRRAQELQRLRTAYANAEMTDRIAILFDLMRFHLRDRPEALSTLAFDDIVRVVEMRRNLERIQFDLFASADEVRELGVEILGLTGRIFGARDPELTVERQAHNLQYLVLELYEPLGL